jgi:hypothetical protein
MRAARHSPSQKKRKKKREKRKKCCKQNKLLFQVIEVAGTSRLALQLGLEIKSPELF